MSKLLSLFEREIDRLATGARADLVLVDDILAYVSHYPQEVHHPMEDLLYAAFARLVPDAASHVADLHGEHVHLTQLTDRLTMQLRAIGAGQMVNRQEVERLGREYVTASREHMEQEDEQIFPAIRESLGETTWRALGRKVAHRVNDPNFHQQHRVPYDRLFYRVTGHHL
jgi:hemerythrin-like domain-containing protein